LIPEKPKRPSLNENELKFIDKQFGDKYPVEELLGLNDESYKDKCLTHLEFKEIGKSGRF
jgi:hypothetical protein